MGTRAYSLVEQKKLQWAKERVRWVIMQTMQDSLWAPLHVVLFNTVIFHAVAITLASYVLDCVRTQVLCHCLKTEWISLIYIQRKWLDSVVSGEDCHSEDSRSTGLPSGNQTHYSSSYDLRRPEVSSENSDSSPEHLDKFTRRRSPSLPPIYKHNYQEENCCDGEGEEGETSGYASDSGERQDYQPSWTHKPRSRPHQSSGWHSSNCLNTPDSLNSEGARPRWGDKGVGVGHLWDASLHNPDARLPALTDRPADTPPAWLCRATDNTVSEVLVITHPEVTSPVTEYGSCDTISNSDRTYLRGQNISIEPEELMERERKRQKAKELQNAIRQQLEEREKKRKEEKERRQKEERLEEERFRKQQEAEQKRLEEEHQKQREKEIKEERKEKAMKEALEIAERLAREEKIKKSKKHKLEVNECPIPVSEEKNIPCVVGSELKIARVEIEQTKPPETQEQQATMSRKEERVPEEMGKEGQIVEELNPPTMEEVEEKKPLPRNVVNLPKEPVKPQVLEVKHLKQTVTESSDDQDIEPDSLDEELSPEIALVLSEPQEVEVNQLSLVVSPGRLLTPSKFRTNPSYEKSTQTDLTKSEIKLPLRRSQQRLEERPKWGVNRPEAQYIKQSERDPYYQTRMRRNTLRVRGKTSKHEREDSRSPSPVNMKVQGNQAPVTVSRGTVTPRVMQMVLPSYNSLRNSRPRYLSFKGGVGAVMAGNVFRQKPEPRPTQPLPEIALVKDVLNQLTSLRQGLTMKQQEWDISRSQTPFSEISSVSTSV